MRNSYGKKVKYNCTTKFGLNILLKLSLNLAVLLFIGSSSFAANIGYVWFSQQSYCDKFNATQYNFLAMFPNLKPMNSVIEIPKGTIFYPSLQTITKINDDYKNFYKKKESGCSDGMNVSYYMVNDDPKCSIRHVNLQKDTDYHEFYSKNSTKHDKGVIKHQEPITYYKAQVLGYVFFECGMQFVLVQSY
jgi:hypothetical protein